MRHRRIVLIVCALVPAIWPFPTATSRCATIVVDTPMAPPAWALLERTVL